MNISDLLGAMMQSGMSPSSGDRMRNALGGGGGSGGGGGLLDALSGMTGGTLRAGRRPGLDPVAGARRGLRGRRSGRSADLLGNVLNDAGQAVGGKQNLALGGLGALAGALLGGGGKSMGGALGGGVMALLGAMAYQALKSGGSRQPEVPVGLIEPRTAAEREELERGSEIVLKAMINAAKADGQIDQGEMQRIVGKLEETGMGPEAQRYVLTEMKNPMNTASLIAAAKGRPTLAAQIYAASLAGDRGGHAGGEEIPRPAGGRPGSGRRGGRADKDHGRHAGLNDQGVFSRAAPNPVMRRCAAPSGAQKRGSQPGRRVLNHLKTAIPVFQGDGGLRSASACKVCPWPV